MKLNCDLGELISQGDFDNDAQIMPFIELANIACGLHAGDTQTIDKTVKLAKHHNVVIGAHPSYDDRENFGRISKSYPDDQLIELIVKQILILNDACKANNVSLKYVKPHGALYNDMMKIPAIFELVCQALQKTQLALTLMLQALPDVSTYLLIAQKYQLPLWFEAFADRSYQDNGLLVPRSEKNAVLENISQIIERYQLLKESGVILSINGKALMMQVDTLCVHGDNQAATDIVKTLSAKLN